MASTSNLNSRQSRSERRNFGRAEARLARWRKDANIVPCGHKTDWPTPYSLTTGTQSNAAARRVPAPSRPAHRDAAKTIPLRQIPAGSFLQVSKPRCSWRRARFSGLNTVVDVSICRNVLRIDNTQEYSGKGLFSQHRTFARIVDKVCVFCYLRLRLPGLPGFV
jgi:hypothetical protein